MSCVFILTQTGTTNKTKENFEALSITHQKTKLNFPKEIKLRHSISFAVGIKNMYPFLIFTGSL